MSGALKRDFSPYIRQYISTTDSFDMAIPILMQICAYDRLQWRQDLQIVRLVNELTSNHGRQFAYRTNYKLAISIVCVIPQVNAYLIYVDRCLE